MPGRDTIFANKFWRVTEDGLEQIGGAGYWITAESLGATDSRDANVLQWPIYMAEHCVEMDPFMEAFLIALWVHSGRYANISSDLFKITRMRIEIIKAEERYIRLNWDDYFKYAGTGIFSLRTNAPPLPKFVHSKNDDEIVVQPQSKRATIRPEDFEVE